MSTVPFKSIQIDAIYLNWGISLRADLLALRPVVPCAGDA
jgi:hypothetical protein